MNSSHLLSLKVKNFRSFYGEQVISFSSDNKPRVVTAIYGPNASGKSNIALTLRFIKDFITNSNNANLTSIPFQPFLLKKGSSENPSSFEVEFLQRERHFVYGFSFDKNRIQREYLLEYASDIKKPRTIFNRTDKLNPSAEKFGFGKKLFESTRQTSLLITKARENNNLYSNIIFDWLTSFNVLLGVADETLQWSLDQLKKNPSLLPHVHDLVRRGDFPIRSFSLVPVQIPDELIKQLPFSEELKQQLSAKEAAGVRTIHAVRDSGQKIVGEQSFDLKSQESSGTQRFFELAAPLLDTIASGKTLYIDEFGSHLHPDLCHLIVSLFKSPANKNNAHLIINTHDTSLMSQDGLLAREDIVFVEKNYAEESIVTPLSSKSVRADESFEKRYRQGLYGAKPQVEIE
jgi:uncharacterized protein